MIILMPFSRIALRLNVEITQKGIVHFQVMQTHKHTALVMSVPTSEPVGDSAELS